MGLGVGFPHQLTAGFHLAVSSAHERVPVPLYSVKYELQSPEKSELSSGTAA
jgi:hypothetical protein